MKITPKIRNILIIFVLFLAGLLVYLRAKSSRSAAPAYQTATAETGTLIVSLSASGQVASTNFRTVSTTASGVVQKVYVREGQKVYTGTPIMQIDLDLDGQQKFQAASASYQGAQNNLATAQSRLYDLEATLVNAKNIFNNQFSMMSPDDPSYIQKHDTMLSAQAAYDQQQNVIAQARNSLASARIAYQMASPTVYAPISGTVSAISLSPGMILNPTSTAANASNLQNNIAIVKTGATPAITVSLTEVDVPKVTVGNKATITLDAYPGKTFTGKVTAVDTSGSVSSGVVSYPTTILLDEDVPNLYSNMSATVNIISKVDENVLMVPTSAVATVNGQSTVRILQNGQPQTVNVETGDSSDADTVITSGLKEGDVVITSTVPTSSTRSGSAGGSVFGGGGGRGVFFRGGGGG